MKRWISLLLACWLFCLTGCSAISTKIPGEGATVNYHLPETVTSIDPQTVQSFAERTVVNALFEGLCRISAKGELQPGVAERWEHNSDYTQYTFYLRKDAVWNNGDPVLAEDFVFAFARALDPATNSVDVQDLFILKNAKEIYAKELPAAELGAVSLDDHTLRITLNSSDKAFPYRTAKAVYMPCDRSFFPETKGRYGLTYRTSHTNGPFSFVNRYSWDERRTMSLCASPTYTGTAVVYPAYVDLTMGGTGSYEDALTALLDGTVDAAPLSAASVEEALVGGCTVDEMNNTTYGILLNPNAEALSSAAVRHALFSTFDPVRVENCTADATVRNIMPADVMWSGAPYRTGVGNCTLPAYDLTAAASVENLDSLTILCENTPLAKNIANTLIVGWNAAFGTYVNMLPLSADELESRVSAGNYQIAITGFTASVFDPYEFLYQILQVCDHAEFRDMLQSATTAAGYFAAEQLLLDQGLFYPLYSSKSYFAQAPYVSGLEINRMTSLDFCAVLKNKK